VSLQASTPPAAADPQQAQASSGQRRWSIQGLRRWVTRAEAKDPDAAALGRVGLRLAALTVGLLAALLLVSSTVIYLTVQNTQLASLKATLERHAATTARFLGDLGVDRAPSPPPPRLRGLRRLDQRGGLQDGSGVFFVVFNASLNIQSQTPPMSPALADRTAAASVLRGGDGYSTRTRNGQQYLVYSLALKRYPSSASSGVVQTAISEEQYNANLHALLQNLLLVGILGLVASGAISAIVVRRALQPIRTALRRQRDFVADAAHELRTPLAIMRSASELGLAADTSLEQQAALEQTLVQNVHLARLVDALSLLARADSGVLSVERRPVDLARLVVETAGAVEVLAEERAVNLSVVVHGGVDIEPLCGAAVVPPGPLIVAGDVGRLRQLILIVLDNALKYTPDSGAVTLTVRVDHVARRVRVEVRDSGPGIDRHDLPHVFDRFYRADRARTSEGSGLGLSIGRWIAETHGGTISAGAVAPPGHGAIFTITLPLAH